MKLVDFVDNILIKLMTKMSIIKIATYSPLCSTKAGREAVRIYNFPSFIDGSCRREPDLENEFPSVSALCRTYQLAPTLHEGSIVIYITKKSFYDLHFKHWKLTAILQVKHRVETHREAANWYSNNNISLPSNCMIIENPPLNIDKTLGFPKGIYNLVKWNEDYQERAKKYGCFLICEAIFKELINPPIVTENDMFRILRTKNPGTQNPKIINERDLNEFLEIAKNSNN